MPAGSGEIDDLSGSDTLALGVNDACPVGVVGAVAGVLNVLLC